MKTFLYVEGYRHLDDDLTLWFDSLDRAVTFLKIILDQDLIIEPNFTISDKPVNYSEDEYTSFDEWQKEKNE